MTEMKSFKNHKNGIIFILDIAHIAIIKKRLYLIIQFLVMETNVKGLA